MMHQSLISEDRMNPEAIMTLTEHQPTLHRLLVLVSAECGVRLTDLTSPRRFRNLTDARKVFYYLAREMTSKSLPQIARVCGRDHSTVLHGYQMARSQMAKYRKQVESVRAKACR